MSFAARLGSHRTAWFAALALLCAATGLVSGMNPKLGLLAALAVGFAAAVLANLTVGLFLFTMLSFLDIINVGSTVSLIKAAGLLLFLSWFATSAVNPRLRARSFLSAHPVVAVAAVAWVAWSLISVAWSESHGTAVTSTYTFLLNVLVLPIVFAAIRDRGHIIWIAAAFMLGAVVSAIIGLTLFNGYRVTGGIGDPNAEAAVLVAALMLSVGLTAAIPRGSPLRLGTLLAGAICLIGAASTGSRGGFIALAVALVGGVVFGGRWRLRAAVLVVVAGLSAGVYVAAFAPPAAIQHLSSSDSEGRIDLWTVGWRMWRANPLTGVGAGNFRQAAVNYVLQPGALTQAGFIITSPHVTHNTYLEVMDELGIPGLIAFLTLVVASIRSSFKAARIFERGGDLRFGLLARCLALAILAMMAASFFISNESEKLVWLLLALPFPVLAVAKSETETQ